MDPMSQSLLDAEYANRFGFGSPTNQYGSVGGGLISDPIYTGGQYSYGDIDPYRVDGPDLFTANDFTPFTATTDPRAFTEPEAVGLLNYVGEHDDASLKDSNAIPSGGLIGGPPSILDRLAAQAATANAANIAAGFSRPDEEERYEPEVSDEEYQDMFG